MTEQEFEVCIAEYGKDIYSFCRQLTNSRAEADDLYQDTFLTAVELREQINCGQNPKSYLLSITLRIWKNKRRKAAWRKRIADVQPILEEQDADMGESAEPSPEECFARRERNTLIRNAVNRLPERLRIVVLLFYMEDLSTAQIAAAMHLPQGTVLSRLHRARKLLKKELEDVLNG